MKADFETGLKTCSKCKRTLPISGFHNDKHCIDGLACHCKDCCRVSGTLHRKLTYEKNKDKRRETQKRWREANRDHIHATNKKRNDVNREKIKDWRLQYYYGISLAEVRARLDELNWKCPGCGCELTEKTYVIDHDHNAETGGYRLILCHSCNSCIGFAKDKPQTLRQIAQLLETQNQSYK